MLMHYHTCPACAETIGGTEADTRAHLAHQIGATVDPEQWRIICHCGQPMAVQWVNECDDCKEEYEPNGDGYNGLCPHCADGADTIIPLSAEQCERIEAICDETEAQSLGDSKLLEARETATILAALRMWQAEAVGVRDELPYDDIASDNGTLVPLDRAEIDALCERLNK